MGNRAEALKRTPTTAGRTNISLYAYRDWKLAGRATAVVNAVSKTTSEVKNIKVLCIGDSKTEANPKRVRINELVADDEYLNLEFLGTRGVSPTLSEGYSGRTIMDVCKNATLNSQTNIFYDDTISGDLKFNFAKGVTALGVAPDIVFVDHGANMISNGSWTEILACYEWIIDSIHAYNSNIAIVICIQESTGLCLNPSNYSWGSKNAYGYMISDSYYSIPKMLAAFDNRENENVFICPQYVCVDLHRDYPIAMLPASEENSMKIEICLDNVHPGSNNSAWSASTSYKLYDYIRRNGKPYAACKASVGVDPETDDGTYWSPILNPEAGYRKIGDMYYAVIKYILSLT